MGGYEQVLELWRRKNITTDTGLAEALNAFGIAIAYHSGKIEAVAYFHAKFENIHPFADGNGRVGRLAMNYLLVLHGHPPIIIHEEDRKEYYAALEAWDTRQKLVPLREFLKRQTEKMWEKQVTRMEWKIG